MWASDRPGGDFVAGSVERIADRVWIGLCEIGQGGVFEGRGIGFVLGCDWVCFFDSGAGIGFELGLFFRGRREEILA